MKKNWIILLLSLMAFGTLADSAHPPLFAQVTPSQKEVFLGQVFFVDVIVNMPVKSISPDPKNLSNFHVTQIKALTLTQTTNTYLLRYAFRAKKEGIQQIPALTFSSKNKTVKSKPVSISVKTPQKSDKMSLELTLSKQSVYLGEPVLLTTIWDSTYPFTTIKSVDFNFPYFNDPRFSIQKRYQPKIEQKKTTTGLPVQGTRILATRKTYKKENKKHQTLRFSLLLTPKKIGKIILPRASILCAVQKDWNKKRRRRNYSAFQYPPYFNNTFFDRNISSKKWIRVYAVSQTPVLQVKALPKENRPKLFQGMVGEYTLSVSAAPRSVHLGEPITLTIKIQSKQIIENITFPSLHQQSALLNHFEIPAERALPQLTKTGKIYTQTIRPLSTNLTQIPSLQLAYFSPTSNKYVIAKSAPIKIKVLPAKKIEVFQNTNSTPPNPFCLVCRILLTLLLLIFLFGFILLFYKYIQKRKQRIRKKIRAEKAYKTFKNTTLKIEHKENKKRALYIQLDYALRSYFSTRFGFNANALSFREIQTHLLKIKINPILVKKLKTLFNRCEAYRFTTHYDEPTDPKTVLNTARTLIDQLEKEIKNQQKKPFPYKNKLSPFQQNNTP